MADNRTFHARLSTACRGPGAILIRESYSAREWCIKTAHVTEPADMRGRYIWNGACTCALEPGTTP